MKNCPQFVMLLAYRHPLGLSGATSLLVLCLLSGLFLSANTVLGEGRIPSSDEMLNGLLPDTKAEGVFRSWKGMNVTRAKKAENESIPSFTVYVTFDFNSSELTTDGELLLSQLGLALVDRRMRKFTFFIGGHTDGVGSESFNIELSQRRADRIRNYLVDQFNIPVERLETFGYGETRLINKDNPEADENRRVEIKNIGPEQ